MSDHRTKGHVCPGCGEPFLLASSLERHRQAAKEARIMSIPSFRAAAQVRNAEANERWRERQIETGRMSPGGEWANGWRPATSEVDHG